MAMSRSLAGTSFTSRPPMVIVPAVMSSRPATMRSAVVLPQPEGPTSTMNSPSATSRSRSATAPARAPSLGLDLATGRRGSRGAHAAGLLARACGAEAALVVNNGAAAVLLVLAALAAGKPVPVSRGELVEIGGAFRVPDVMAQSGARLVEVGTTNRTRPADYERAVGPDVALVLKVHQSNYRIVGFTAAVSVPDLAGLGPPVVVD